MNSLTRPVALNANKQLILIVQYMYRVQYIYVVHLQLTKINTDILVHPCAQCSYPLVQYLSTTPHSFNGFAYRSQYNTILYCYCTCTIAHVKTEVAFGRSTRPTNSHSRHAECGGHWSHTHVTPEGRRSPKNML